MENIKRYQGISASRLEQMEARLKEDILAEARKNDGLILVHDEIGVFLSLAVSLTAVYRKRKGNSHVDGCRYDPDAKGSVCEPRRAWLPRAVRAHPH